MEYFRQKYLYTCGPASLRMVLDSLGIRKSRDWTIKALKASRRAGTKNHMMAVVCEQLKLNFVVQRNSELSDVENFLRKGFRVIITYMPPDEDYGHFAVLLKMDKEHVFLHDPWYGPDYRLKRSTLQRKWKDCEGNKRWLIAIKNS